MQILNEGKKELIGKVFFKCEECECEFIADEGEWESYLVTSPNTAVIDCPMCGSDLRTHIDEGPGKRSSISESSMLKRKQHQP